jgi:hypothetical protein
MPHKLNHCLGAPAIARCRLGDLAYRDADVLVILACVRLRGLAPASIEQRLRGGYAGRRWCGQ